MVAWWGKEKQLKGGMLFVSAVIPMLICVLLFCTRVDQLRLCCACQGDADHNRHPRCVVV